MKKSSKKPAGKVKASPPKGKVRKVGNKPAHQADPVAVKQLTTTEKRLLESYEYIIGVGLNCYETVGQTLSEISDKRLYRAKHKTFKDYCKVRWQMGRAHAYRLMNAARFLALLKDDGDGKIPLPAHESLVRPIIDGLRESRWIKAWKQALKSAKGRVLTAETVAEEVAKLTGQSRRGGLLKATDGKQAQQRVFKSIRNLVNAALRKRNGASIDYFKRVMNKILARLGTGSTTNKPKSKD